MTDRERECIERRAQERERHIERKSEGRERGRRWGTGELRIASFVFQRRYLAGVNRPGVDLNLFTENPS